jgi:hypothetical protein
VSDLGFHRYAAAAHLSRRPTRRASNPIGDGILKAQDAPEETTTRTIDEFRSATTERIDVPPLDPMAMAEICSDETLIRFQTDSEVFWTSAELQDPKPYYKCNSISVDATTSEFQYQHVNRCVNRAIRF